MNEQQAPCERQAPREELGDGEGRLLSAFDDAVERLAEAARAQAHASSWQERMRRALTAMLELAERRPSLARLLLVEAEASSPALAARRKQVLERLATTIEAGFLGTDRLGTDRLGTDRLGADRLGTDRLGADRAAGGSGAGAAMAVDREGGTPRQADALGFEGLEMESVLAAAGALVWSHMCSQDRRLVELVDPLMAMLVLRHEGPDGSARQLCAQDASARPG